VLNLQKPSVPGDFNQDGKKNLQDLLLLVKHLFKPVTTETVVFDLDQDGRITFLDMLVFAKL